MPMTDPWRYRCPNGHTTFQYRSRDPRHGVEAGSKYYCSTCNRNGLDPHHDVLIDHKTGKEAK